MLDFDIKDLGFTEDDIAEVWGHFEYRLQFEDWESMLLFENNEEIFKYLYIDNQDTESIIDTLLEMGKISVDDLKEGQSAIEYMIECDNSIFKLPAGRWVIFSRELLHKEDLAQID
ncbi:hypothetical protein V7024_10710 [Bacillus sp. JJ864]|uniref:hypothetical protein n=1 Tax=Bacillus sp. JJ864 TaxID=3122975 RepID=UPI002FFEE2C6